MLHIFLMILKILGIIVLCLLALLILSLCLILFVPIVFEGEVKNTDSFSLKGKISWLVIGAKGIIDYQEELNFSLRIFGVRIFPKKEKRKKNPEEEKNTGKKKSEKEEERQLQEKKEEQAEPYFEIKESDSEKERRISPEAGEKQNKDSLSEEKKHDKKHRIFSKKKIARRKKKKNVKREKKGSAIFAKIKQYLGDEKFKEALMKAVSYLFDFLRKIHIKEAEGELAFSLGAPDLTGQSLGLISMFPFAYSKKLSIDADFLVDDPYFKGNLKMGGSLQLIYVLIFIIRLVRDKQIRKVISSIQGKS
jgi:hypothetical protein